MKQDCFRPKYTVSHWLNFFREFILYLLYVGVYVWRIESFQSLVSAGKSNGFDDSLPVPTYDLAIVFAFGLLGALLILSMMRFLAEHIRKVQVTSEGIVFYRGLGRRLTAEYGTVEWDDSLLALSKRHTFELNKISNREAMKEYLAEYLAKPSETSPEQSKPKKVYTTWDDIKVLLGVVVAICIFSLIAFLPQELGLQAGSQSDWILDAVLGVVVFVDVIFLARNLIS